MQAISRSRSQRGFTIVELLTVIAVLGILLVLVLGTLGDFYQSNTTSLTQTVQSTDTRSILRTIESDIVGTSGFLKATSMTPVTPTGSDDATAAWDFKGDGTNRVLIASIYATDKAPSDPNYANRSLVYISGTGCDPATAVPLQYNLVYYVKQASNGTKNLYRRTMMPPDTQCAPGAAQKQSCTAAKITGNANCKAPDAVLLYDISNFTVDYFTDANGTTPIDYIAGDITSAKSIKVTITTQRRINGVMTPYSSSIRISRLN
jgi:prepilin-type N-terminal cleavage/methylation domain-containing protein